MAAVLAGLFPPFVHTVLEPLDGHLGPPFDEEAAAVATAAPSRRHEFLRGRACAHAALAAIGADAGPIGAGPGREPSWPAGVVGSISHAGAWVAAAVARTGDAWGLGVDLEVLGAPLEPALERLVLTPVERLHHGSGAAGADPHGATIVFSIKECVYKCLFPPTRLRLEPHDVTVETDPGTGTFTARLTQDVAIPGTSALLEGRYALACGYVLSALCVGAGGVEVR
jgi:4'-phosphopantetheinyl transferase EntD